MLVPLCKTVRPKLTWFSAVPFAKPAASEAIMHFRFTNHPCNASQWQQLCDWLNDAECLAEIQTRGNDSVQVLIALEKSTDRDIHLDLSSGTKQSSGVPVATMYGSASKRPAPRLKSKAGKLSDDEIKGSDSDSSAIESGRPKKKLKTLDNIRSSARVRNRIDDDVSQAYSRAPRARVSGIPPDQDTQLLRFPAQGKGGVAIFRSDEAKLRAGEFLNDTIIEFALKYIHKTLEESVEVEKRSLAVDILVFSSFFYKGFTSEKDKALGYEKVRKWTKGDITFNKKYIIVPINENLHWYMALIVNPRAILTATAPKADDANVSEDATMLDRSVRTARSSTRIDASKRAVDNDPPGSPRARQADDDTEMTTEVERPDELAPELAAAISPQPAKASAPAVGDEQMKFISQAAADGGMIALPMEDEVDSFPQRHVIFNPHGEEDELHSSPDDKADGESDALFPTDVQRTPEIAQSPKSSSPKPTGAPVDFDCLRLDTPIDARMPSSAPRSGHDIVEESDEERPAGQMGILSDVAGTSVIIANHGQGALEGGGAIVPGAAHARSQQGELVSSHQRWAAVEESPPRAERTGTPGTEPPANAGNEAEGEAEGKADSQIESKAEKEENGKSQRKAETKTRTYAGRPSVSELRLRTTSERMSQSEVPIVITFDSLKKGNNGKVHAKVAKELSAWLRFEAKEKMNVEVDDRVVCEHVDAVVPQQPNYSDCGIYVIHYFERFASDPAEALQTIVSSTGDARKPYVELTASAPFRNHATSTTTFGSRAKSPANVNSGRTRSRSCPSRGWRNESASGKRSWIKSAPLPMRNGRRESMQVKKLPTTKLLKAPKTRLPAT